jgi:hypothetical protein
MANLSVFFALKLLSNATHTLSFHASQGNSLRLGWHSPQLLRRRYRRLPDRLHRALTLDWSEISEDLASASAVFVTSRGLGLSSAREVALKLAEILLLPALWAQSDLSTIRGLAVDPFQLNRDSAEYFARAGF